MCALTGCALSNLPDLAGRRAGQFRMQQSAITGGAATRRSDRDFDFIRDVARCPIPPPIGEWGLGAACQKRVKKMSQGVTVWMGVQSRLARSGFLQGSGSCSMATSR